MTREEWRRIKAVAAGAWDQPASARAAFVAAACVGDDALRAEVERLLQSTDDATDLYELPALATPSLVDAFVEDAGVTASFVGMAIGPYRLTREIGHGGMGRVFLAERVDGAFDQRVAIKFVGGLPTAALLQRFRDERRILASLDHPNIARLIDGGATPDGHPFVIMEYVEGLPIDEFSETRHLNIKACVVLFRRVCDAVQYAHQRLVIHRDLKARNILVTADGTPKLLDFGIAKLVDSGPVASEPTRTMFRLMTPETASPEQIRGEPVTTATDVYALGGLLYRLLTAQSPYELESSTDTEWMRAICEQTPIAPSRRAPQRVSIDRDLDLIVLKALRKEPERRYATVSQLSEDLQRYLDGRPVQAAPDDRAYRLRKFVGRHRLALGAAAALGLAIAGGTLATARQAQIARRERARAEGRFDDVRQLANSFMFEVHDAIQNLPGSTPARRLLITRVLEYLEKLNRDATLESPLLLEIATAYQKVGNVQGNPFYANIGDAAGAMQSYRKALAIAQGLVDRDPNASNRTALAASHHLLADLFWGQGSFPDALEHYRLALTLRETLSAEDAANETRRLDLALSHYGVGQTLLRTGDYNGAVDAYTQAQRIQADVLERNPSSVVARRSFATTAAKVGDVMAVQGDHARALESHSQAVAILEELVARDTANAPIKRTLGLILYRMSNDQNNIGDYQRTLATGKRALDLLTPILESDPSNVQALMDTATIRRVLSDALIGLHRQREALAELDIAEKSLRKVQSVTPDYAENSSELGMTLIARADLLAELGDRLPARQAYRDATTLLDRNAARAESARYRGLAHEHAGDLERRLAQSAGASVASEHLRDACRHYRLGIEALQARSGQDVDPRDAASIETLSSKLSACR